MSCNDSADPSCASTSPPRSSQDATKVFWKARARSHNSGLNDPLSRAFCKHASSPESDDAALLRTSLRDHEACRGAAAARGLPLHCCGSSGRLSAAAAAKRSFVGTVLLWSCLVLAGMVAARLSSPGRRAPDQRVRASHAAAEDAALAELRTSPAARADTLILYAYSSSDSEYEHNLGFFVKYGMAEGDGCDYVIIGSELFSSRQLPPLPRNAQYVLHENRCFDWGTFGWAMAEGKVAPARYSYIIFMNSSVRGPFLPAFWPTGVHWSAVLTTRLSDAVKLVGPTISCEPAWAGSGAGRERRQVPHVQSYVVATDQVGLGILRRDGRVFACYDDMADTIFHAELGASAAVLAANRSIDSLMLRYQGADWTDASNWDCNAGRALQMLNPCADGAYDGAPLNPLEVMFVKVKAFQLESEWVSSRLASTYDRWLAQGAGGDITSNDYARHRAAYKLPKALAMQRRGSACFDHEFYRSRSRDLPPAWAAAQLWDHFVQDGQFEGRPSRFNCENPLRNEAAAQAMMRASGQDLDRVMAAAAAAVQASAAAAAHTAEAQSRELVEEAAPSAAAASRR